MTWVFDWGGESLPHLNIGCTTSKLLYTLSLYWSNLHNTKIYQVHPSITYRRTTRIHFIQLHQTPKYWKDPSTWIRIMPYLAELWLSHSNARHCRRGGSVVEPLSKSPKHNQTKPLSVPVPLVLQVSPGCLPRKAIYLQHLELCSAFIPCITSHTHTNSTWKTFCPLPSFSRVNAQHFADAYWVEWVSWSMSELVSKSPCNLAASWMPELVSLCVIVFVVVT